MSLTNGGGLALGESLFSQDGQTELKMGNDGKPEVYVDGELKWQSDNDENDNVRDVYLQDDGNFVMSEHDDTPIWASMTHGKRNVICVVQNDGNVVLYEAKPAWSTDTWR
ncbi:bulb-type lectin domain-containing protein [Aspergillus sergii]|uniref:Bulb-type lectin domain-containing protein n=1 Tax=Aspergillus sergii TaxID=1034303 RepID=A0A5N6WU76_9EURO|nr:bulb-type lectin domain-containing protein [Aspergillus sergii]